MGNRVTVTRAKNVEIIDRPWDSGPAEKRLKAWAMKPSGEIDFDKLATAYLLGDPSTGLLGDLHFPIGDIVDGKMVLNAAALRAARSRLGQGFPLVATVAEREQANKRAGELLDKFRESKSDAAEDDMVVALSVPAELGTPVDEPHVTFVYLPNVPPEKADDVALIVADELWMRCYPEGRIEDPAHGWPDSLSRLWDATLTTAGLRYFENEGERVAYAAVVVPPHVSVAREQLAERLAGMGFRVSRDGQNWVPHITLGRMTSGEVYTGPVPAGSWKPTTLEVWRRNGDRWIIGPGAASGVDKLERTGDRWTAYRNAGRVRIGEFETEAAARQALAEDAIERELAGRMDRLTHRQGKWLALSSDGTKVLGTYETEAEARERLRQVEAAKAAKDDFRLGALDYIAEVCGPITTAPVIQFADLGDAETHMDRSAEEKAEIRKRWQNDGPNMGAARMREWLDSPFAGPNRKTGDERARARRVAERAFRLMEKSTADWTDADYTGALQVLAFIERMSKVEQGEPLTIDGRKGPSARDASLRDWGYEPKADGQQVLFDVNADGSVTLRIPPGMFGGGRSDGILGALNLQREDGRRPPSPAIHTESRVHVETVYRADKVEFSTEHSPVRHPDGWVLYPVLYSRAGNVQTYGNVREYRDPRVVFDRASLDTGIGNPWELRHSADLLSPRSVLGVARGAIVTVDEYHDGLHTFGWSKAWDADLIEAIEGRPGERPEAPEVSVAYRCKIDKRPGTSDFGQPFDQRQMDIVWNSLASEPYGRAQTARVLTARADAITVNAAADLLALASGRRPSRPVYISPETAWRRFDSATTPRPSITDIHKDANIVTNKALIKAAQALGVTDEAISQAVGMAIADLPTFMASEKELTPDQVNALISILPPEPKMPAPAADGYKPPMADMDPGESGAGMPMIEEAKIMIGDVEYEVPKAVAEHIAGMMAKMAEANGRADRASKRAEKAEADLSKADVELAKRSDAMKSMVSRADAERMAVEYGTNLAGAMELARRCRGVDFTPDARKDSASGEDMPVTLADWQRAVIGEAFGARATDILARIDAAPNDAVREFMLSERMNDARHVIDARSDKSANALIELDRQRKNNAAKDGQERSDAAEDPFAAARRERLNLAETQQVGSNNL